jgi:hypothetical protein
VLVTVVPTWVVQFRALKTPIPTELVAAVVLAMTFAVIQIEELPFEGWMVARVSEAIVVTSTLFVVELAITVNPVLPQERCPVPSVIKDWPEAPVELGRVKVRLAAVEVLGWIVVMLPFVES